MTWTMTRLMDLATGYWAAGALMAAVELDLFRAIQDGGATSAETAERIGASEPHADALLTALAGLGLLRLSAGRFSMAPDAAPFLDSRGETCLLDALRFNKDLYGLWGRLSETVRHGRPALPPGAHLGTDPGRTRRFVMGMHSRALGLAPDLLPALPVPPEGRLLDVAAGPGTFSRRLAEDYPALDVTQFDLPPVLEIARELAGASPARERLQFLPGNYRTDALGGPYDAVLFCGALHQEAEADARNLTTRMASALRPGGRLIVVDLMLDGDAPTPAFAALFGLTMMLTAPAGGVYSTDQAVEMLHEAGIRDVEIRAPADLPYRIVFGHTPRG